jgi:membrane protease YdiL (CAAX protease family)
VGLFALLAGLVGLAVFFSSRHKWPPVGFVGFDKSDGDRYMVRFAGYLVAFLALSLAAGSLGETRFAESPWFTTVVMALIGVAMLVWLGAPSLGRADRASEVVGVRRPFWRLVATGLYGYLCTLPLLLVALGLIVLLSKVFPAPSHPISGEFATASGLEWVALLATAVVLAPLTEEFAFRGLLLPALATQLRPLTAVLLCGFFFAAIHPQGPLVWPALMTTGAAAAYLRYQTGSLVPSMTLHALHNGAIFLFAYLVG